jgi:hypothetical protein
MLLKCGFLGKSAGYYYTIQNVVLHSTGWSSMKIIFNGQILGEYHNDGKEMKIFTEQDNNYNIILFVNNNKVKSERQLFDVLLDVKTEGDASDFFHYEDSMIVDH